MRVGYACMNNTLKEQGFKRRRLTKAGFAEGLEGVTEVAYHNILILAKMIMWNEEHGIKFVRTTDLIPWMDHIVFEDLPDWANIQANLKIIGDESREMGHRITVHPSAFCVLASENYLKVMNTVHELNANGKLFDEFGFEQNHFNKINIHVGGVYDDKKKTMERFCKNFEHLHTNVQNRLTIENDDSKNGYTVEDLYHGIYKKINTPIVMDLFHHELNPGKQSEDEALDMAASTWTVNETPVVHISSSRKEFEDSEVSTNAHADYIYRSIPKMKRDTDVMVEAKKTELAVLRLLE